MKHLELSGFNSSLIHLCKHCNEFVHLLDDVSIQSWDKTYALFSGAISCGNCGFQINCEGHLNSMEDDEYANIEWTDSDVGSVTYESELTGKPIVNPEEWFDPTDYNSLSDMMSELTSEYNALNYSWCQPNDKFTLQNMWLIWLEHMSYSYALSAKSFDIDGVIIKPIVLLKNVSLELIDEYYMMNGTPLNLRQCYLVVGTYDEYIDKRFREKYKDEPRLLWVDKLPCIHHQNYDCFNLDFPLEYSVQSSLFSEHSCHFVVPMAEDYENQSGEVIISSLEQMGYKHDGVGSYGKCHIRPGTSEALKVIEKSRCAILELRERFEQPEHDIQLP